MKLDIGIYLLNTYWISLKNLKSALLNKTSFPRRSPSIWEKADNNNTKVWCLSLYLECPMVNIEFIPITILYNLLQFYIDIDCSTYIFNLDSYLNHFRLENPNQHKTF